MKKILTLLLIINCVLSLFHPTSQAQVLSTIAGNGFAGYSGDNGPALAAQLYHPQGIVFDTAGNLFIGDAYNFVVRRIDAQTGVITTVAGNGVQGYGGDGGPATQAMLNSPTDIAFDLSGNLLIADPSNMRIRKVDMTTGIITTFAGTGVQGYDGDGAPATARRLNTPQGVAVDGSGNVYIADVVNRRVRKVSASTGIIATIAGIGIPTSSGDGGPATSAGLTSPRRVAVDAASNVYILDNAFNARIRKVDVATGIITRVAGGGTLVADSGVATDMNLGGGSGLTDIAFDASGDLFITTVLKVFRVSNGIAVAIAGKDTAGFSGDGGDPRMAKFNYILGVAVYGCNDIFLSDMNNDRIRKIAYGMTLNYVDADMDGYGAINTQPFCAIAGPGNSTTHYDCDDNNANINPGNPDTTSLGTLKVETIIGTGSAGYSGDSAAANAAQINNPQSVVLDKSGNLFIADAGNCVIRGVHPHGSDLGGLSYGSFETGDADIFTIAGNGTCGYSGDGGPATSAQIASPADIDFHANTTGILSQYILIADQGNHRIRKVVLSRDWEYYGANTGIITTVAGTGTPGFSGDGGAATAAQINSPDGIAIDDAGNYYIADKGNYRIRKVEASSGNISTICGTGLSAFTGDGGPATAASLSSPRKVAVDDEGNIYILDKAANPCIRMIDAVTGVITRVAGGGNITCSDSAIATDMNLGELTDVTIGELEYVAPSEYQTILITSTTRIWKVYVKAEYGPGSLTGTAVAIAGTGVPGFSGDGDYARLAKFSNLSGVVFRPRGLQDGLIFTQEAIFVSDRSNNRIRMIWDRTFLDEVRINFIGINGATQYSFGSDLTTVGCDFEMNYNLNLRSIGSTIEQGLTNLETIGCDLTAEGNPLLGIIQFESLSFIGGDVNIINNSVLNAINLQNLSHVDGNLTITDNGNGYVNLSQNGTVLGSMLISTAAPGADIFNNSLESGVWAHNNTINTLNLFGWGAGGRLKVEVTNVDTVKVNTAGDTTEITMINTEAMMWSQLWGPDQIPFSVARIETSLLAPESGSDAAGAPAMIDPVVAYNFTVDLPANSTLNSELFFQVYLDHFSTTERQVLLDAYLSGTATVAVKGDSAGSGYEALPVCLGTQTPGTNGCVKVIIGIDPLYYREFMRFDFVPPHFSTWAVVIVDSCLSVFYADSDSDGYGNILIDSVSCLPPTGFVTNDDDCNDTLNAVHPGAAEICNGMDDNCNGQIDEGCPVNLYVRVFLEGFYIGGDSMMAVVDPVNYPNLSDSITIELHDAASPHGLAYSVTSVMDKYGIGKYSFPVAVLDQTYYIVVKHRNSIETWSKNPVLFNNREKGFDFTRQ